MLTFIDLNAANVIGIRLDGTIDTQEFDAVTKRMNQIVEDYGDIRIYIELVSFKGISLKGLIEDLKFGIKNWNRFAKQAVVTEKKWVKKWAGLGSKIGPDMNVKVFSFDEQEEAKKWIQE